MKAYMTIVKIRNWLKRNEMLVAIVKKTRKLKSRTARISLQKFGLKAASEITQSLHEIGFECFVSSGTLLGIVREGELLRHDVDLDFCAIVDENFSWAKAVDRLSKLGFYPTLIYTLESKVTEISFDSSQVSFDLFGAFPIKGDDLSEAQMRVYSCARQRDVVYAVPEATTSSYRDFPAVTSTLVATVSGYDIRLPVNAEAWLETNYGPTWRIPDSSWDSKTGLTVIEDMDASRIVVKRHHVNEIEELLKRQG